MITNATFIIECEGTDCNEEIEIDGVCVDIHGHYEPNWNALRFLGWTKPFGCDLCPSCSKEEDDGTQ